MGINSELSRLVETIILRMLKQGSNNNSSLKKSLGLKNISSVPLFIDLWFQLFILVDFYTLIHSLNSSYPNSCFS